MVAPRKIPVYPLVRTTDSEVALRLDDVFKLWQARGVAEPFVIRGASGSGKTKALEYLRPLLDEAGYQGLDEPRRSLPRLDRIVLTTAAQEGISEGLSCGFQCELEPWSDDEVLDWLLAERPSVCASVMRRLKESGEQAWLKGNPRLWVLCLERMAVDAGLSGPIDAIYSILDELLVGEDHNSLSEAVQDAATEAGSQNLMRWLPAITERGDLGSVLGHTTVRQILSAEILLTLLATGRGLEFVEIPIRSEVYDLAARRAAQTPGLVARIRERFELLGWSLESGDGYDAWACAFLIRVDREWRPSERVPEDLAGAQLQDAQWQGVSLPSCELAGADLSGADLSEANLKAIEASDLIANRVDLRRADLEEAYLFRARCREAQLSGAGAVRSVWRTADLRGADCSDSDFKMASLVSADLRDSTWHRANLKNADLSEAQLDGADFLDAVLVQTVLARSDLRAARFDGAVLKAAVLYRSNLEGICALSVDFSHAGAMESLWTNSFLRDCRMSSIVLRRARLAGIDWEGVDLRDADLSNVTFHTGTSRSGLIDSSIPSEGSRTGFYTDESHELGFRAPEEIRVANLCNVDLRGARLEDSDFYLVDLRGAKLTPPQHTYLKNCGAIL